MKNGAKIAGTGTMDVTGEVGPIGGIRQKLVGARRDGAAWFLAPASNCDEVVGHVPAGLRVVKVATLGDAVAAMTAIGKGTGDSLPTCTAGRPGRPARLADLPGCRPGTGPPRGAKFRHPPDTVCQPVRCFRATGT